MFFGPNSKEIGELIWYFLGKSRIIPWDKRQNPIYHTYGLAGNRLCSVPWCVIPCGRREWGLANKEGWLDVFYSEPSEQQAERHDGIYKNTPFPNRYLWMTVLSIIVVAWFDIFMVLYWTTDQYDNPFPRLPYHSTHSFGRAAYGIMNWRTINNRWMRPNHLCLINLNISKWFPYV